MFSERSNHGRIGRALTSGRLLLLSSPSCPVSSVHAFYSGSLSSISCPLSPISECCCSLNPNNKVKSFFTLYQVGCAVPMGLLFWELVKHERPVSPSVISSARAVKDLTLFLICCRCPTNESGSGPQAGPERTRQRCPASAQPHHPFFLFYRSALDCELSPY